MCVCIRCDTPKLYIHGYKHSLTLYRVQIRGTPRTWVQKHPSPFPDEAREASTRKWPNPVAPFPSSAPPKPKSAKFDSREGPDSWGALPPAAAAAAAGIRTSWSRSRSCDLGGDMGYLSSVIPTDGSPVSGGGLRWERLILGTPLLSSFCAFFFGSDSCLLYPNSGFFFWSTPSSQFDCLA